MTPFFFFFIQIRFLNHRIVAAPSKRHRFWQILHQLLSVKFASEPGELRPDVPHFLTPQLQGCSGPFLDPQQR
jgi:hypothetical protein